jgi:hypothetical protein
MNAAPASMVRVACAALVQPRGRCGPAFALLTSLLIATGSCSTNSECGACVGPQAVALDLSCAPDVVTSATLGGPCAPLPPGDASGSGGSGAPSPGFICDVATQTPFVDCRTVFFFASGPGDCHVALTFANGFTYAADVHYGTAPQDCECADTLVPSVAVLAVKEPLAACVADAGLAAPAPD